MKLLLLLTLAIPALPADLLRLSQFVLAGGVTADAATTEIALRRPGVYEANPLQRNRGVRLGTHAGIAIGLPLLESRALAGKGRRARLVVMVLNVGIGVGFGLVARHNAQIEGRR